MVTYVTAQYRHVVVCSGLYPVRSQSLHGGYSSGCFESAMQPSSTEKIKSSRTTLHYVIQNDSARDLVLCPGPLGQPWPNVAMETSLAPPPVEPPRSTAGPGYIYNFKVTGYPITN